MFNKKLPKKLLKETMAIVRLYQFLRYDSGLKIIDKTSLKDLKKLLSALQ